MLIFDKNIFFQFLKSFVKNTVLSGYPSTDDRMIKRAILNGKQLMDLNPTSED